MIVKIRRKICQHARFLRLECDQECATLERNKRLAEALQIDPSSDPFNVRSTSTYSDILKEDARSVILHFLFIVGRLFIAQAVY